MSMDYLIMLAALTGGLAIILSTALFKRHRIEPPKPEKRKAAGHDEFAVYKKLTATQPDNPEHWLRWGNALAVSAPNAKHPDLIAHRYNEACACFQRAIELTPDHGQVWKSWGQTLFEMYRLQRCEDQQILGQANQKYQNAVLLSPDNSLIWQQWGEELRQAAHIAIGELKTALMEESVSKTTRGLELNAGFAPAAVSPQKEDAPGGEQPAK